MAAGAFVWRGVAARVLEALPEGQQYFVVAFDFFGRGMSVPTAAEEQRHGLDNYLQQIDRVLVGLGITRPIVLCGHSMGGACAAAFAARYPGRVERLVLVAPAGLPGLLPSVHALVRLPVAEAVVTALFNTLVATTGLPHAAFAHEFWDTSSPGVAYLKSHVTEIAQRNPHWAQALFRALAEFPLDSLEPVYASLANRLPVLIVWGRQDGLVPVEMAGTLAALMPQARVQILPASRHSCMIEQEAAFAGVLLAWLAATQPKTKL
eukprot:TRINITY_DN15048_c0_g1_i1.p2 TRINITY_DN15048_c0_g1~~TRINITY_DN15048_c0_g1_i1.p2  ORF type:complete len:302 (+),score=74.10 TRINITY_DN15048_c0_g1_i1:115-906(+)